MSGSGLESREIRYLFEFYFEVQDGPTRQNILGRLIDSIPFGHHPLRYTENVLDPDRRIQIRQYASRELNDQKLIRDLESYVARPDLDLETGVYLVSRLSNMHTITPEDFARDLDRLARPLAERMEKLREARPSERLEALVQYLFVDEGFRGNTEDYYAPENSYLTALLDSRMGIPVSLSVLAILVGRRAGLDLEGINLPGHFVVRFGAGPYSTYFDPFNEGTVLSEEDCVRFMLRQGVSPSQEYFRPADTGTILKRMYRNLINHYSSTGDRKKEETLSRHFLILQNHTLYR